MCVVNNQANIFRLGYNTSVKFEIVSQDIAACTLRMVNEACDVVENKLGFNKITILPPVEGTTEFEVFASEDNVIVDLHQIKRELVEALEAMV